MKQAAPAATASGRVTLNMKTGRILVGKKWFAPNVIITNSQDVAITVTDVELGTSSVRYSNSHLRPDSYPRTVPAGSTGELDVCFDLKADVEHTFSTEARLGVHYNVGDHSDVVEAAMIGGPLD